MLLFNSFPYFAAEDTGSGALSVEDMIEKLGETDGDDDGSEKVVIEGSEDLLADEEDKTPPKTGKKEDEQKEEKKEEEEVELEEEEPEDEELDSKSQDVPRREILKKYPTLFKDFPQLQTAYYREQKYAEILPTIEDAKVAVEKAQNFDKFEESLLGGDPSTVLNSLKSGDEEAFAKVVDNYLPALQKVDKGAYYHILANIAKNFVAGMVNEGERIKNDQLKMAAVILNQFVFGSSEFQAPKNFSSDTEKPNEEVQKLNQQKQEFLQQRFDTALNDLSNSAKNIIKSTINTHIDPKNVMTDYVKRVAVGDALDAVEKMIEIDTRFRAQLDKLWERAFSTNFSKDATDNIKRAYLNKAKTLLPDAIRKSRNEALKGLGKRVTDNQEEPTKKGHAPVGRSASADNRSKQEIPKGMKTLDYLMQD